MSQSWNRWAMPMQRSPINRTAIILRPPTRHDARSHSTMPPDWNSGYSLPVSCDALPVLISPKRRRPVLRVTPTHFSLSPRRIQYNPLRAPTHLSRVWPRQLPGNTMTTTNLEYKGKPADEGKGAAQSPLPRVQRHSGRCWIPAPDQVEGRPFAGMTSGGSV
jgi:hypothetical protein